MKSKQKSSISDEQLKSYIIQKPNKKILGTRFHVFLYNLSNEKKEKWPHNWLRKIGEQPVVFSSELTKTSTEQLKQFLENKGYYNAIVSDSVVFKRRNAKVTYDIELNDPYKIKKISYFFEDTSLMSYILPDTVNSRIATRRLFDKDLLKEERERIETLLKQKGYFSFSKEHIFYDVTLMPENNGVNITMHVKEYDQGIADPYSKVKYHPRYKIRDVFVYPNLSDINAESIGLNTESYDTITFGNLYFLTTEKPNLRPSAIANRNYIIPGTYYRLNDVTRTYRNISALNIIQFTNISFKETDTIPTFGSEKFLDCKIELTQKKLQSLQADIAGTNSSGDLGVRGNLLYSNYNLFKGAEVFNLRFTGAIESLKNQTNGDYKSMKEVGAETNIVFPKFFSPFRLEGFVKKFAPKTVISVSYNYQSRPDFTRSVANSSFSYNWKSNTYLSHTVWPLELSYVQIYEDYSDRKFLDSIYNTPLGYSFVDHVINMARYSVELNNQTIGKTKNFVFARLNLESAGNMLNLINTGFNPKDTAYSYELFKVPYFQYLLGDIDLRYYHVIDKQNKFVYRLFAGVGYPFGNNKALPYEKKYFSGGPNSIRAWNTRDLGPGSDTSRTSFASYPNKNGDIKLEANIEYRFKLIWKIEAALFLDAGNVWEIRPNAEKPNAVFEWNRFYKEIAVGSGFGARFDFSFFLLRIDVGIKLRDPALPENNRWIPVFKDFGLDDLHWKFGIGYPF